MRAAWMLVGIAAAGAAVRIPFVLWAPGVPTGDGFFYHLLALQMLAGQGFVSPDGSPGILWPPAWPALMALVYWLAGTPPHVIPVANAVLGSITAALIAMIGWYLFDVRTGLIAGLIYALWPGPIYYCATYFGETAFNLVLVSFLAVTMLIGWRRKAGEPSRAPNSSPSPLSWHSWQERGNRKTRFFSPSLPKRRGRGMSWWVAGSARSRRLLLCAAAGALLGAASLVKAEPVVLLPIVWAVAWVHRRSLREFALAVVLSATALAAVVAPWTYRNYRVFDRFIPTSASGGMNVYVGNAPGANGAANFFIMTDYMQRYQRENFAQTAIAGNAAGYRDAWEFIRAHPRHGLANAALKLVRTYEGDSEAVLLIHGIGHEDFIPVSTCERLATLANWSWYGLLLFAGIGLCSVRSWPRDAQILICGVLLLWTLVQLAVFGGQRFHVPQYPAYALAAAVGVRTLEAAVRSRLARHASVP